MTNPTTRFTGIFIPSEIFEIEGLTPLDWVLLAMIDALYCKEHGGCYASNLYLAQKMNVQENTIAKALTKFRQMKLIADVSFDGRKRVMRSLVNKIVEERQSKTALDLNPRGVGFKSNTVLDQNPSPPYIDSKDYTKEYKSPPAPKGVDRDSSFQRLKFGSHVKLHRHEYDEFIQLLNKDKCDELIAEMNDYCAANRPRGYSNWAAAMRNWIRKRKSDPKPKVDSIETNRKLADRVIKTFGEKHGRTTIEVTSTYIGIGESPAITFLSFTDKGFEDQLRNLMRKWKIPQLEKTNG
jgi:hypothetical protein